MGFKAEIWAWRWGGMEKEKEEKEKEEEKIPLCKSIGHQPLQGRCSKICNLVIQGSHMVSDTQCPAESDQVK